METATFNAQYALAMQALGLHMETHHLPAPAAIDTIEYHHFGQQITHMIRLRLPAFADQQAAWLNTVAIDAEATEEVELGFRATFSVRLPDTGFRFELVALRPHPLRTVVTA